MRYLDICNSCLNKISHLVKTQNRKIKTVCNCIAILYDSIIPRIKYIIGRGDIE